MSVGRAEVLEVLRSLDHPGTGKNLIEADVVRALTVEDGRIRFVLEVAPEHGRAMEPVRQAAISRLEALVGEGNVSALLTAHSEKKPPDLKIGRHPEQPKGPQKVPGVEKIIAVASGKGGVGKSTVSSPTSPWRWPPKAGASACSTPTSTAPRSRGCWASAAVPPRPTARPSCRSATTASR